MPEEFRAATPRVAAGVLFKDSLGRVLLVKPTYKQGWDIPGGYVEPGESPLSAAIREVHEELGLSLPIGRLLVVDWAPHPDEGDKLLFIFDGGEIEESGIREGDLQTNEIAETRFASAGELPDLLPERLFTRISSALATPANPYLEHGARGTGDGQP